MHRFGKSFTLTLAMLAFADANAQVPPVQEYGVFARCNACGILTNNPTTLALIQTAITDYSNQSGEIPLAVGDMVQLESYAGSPAGYTLTERFFQITHLPVAGWTDLVTFTPNYHYSDTYTVLPPPQGDILAYLGNFAFGGGIVIIYYGTVPYIFS